MRLNVLVSLFHKVLRRLWGGEVCLCLSIWELYWNDKRASWLLWQMPRWGAVYGLVGSEMHKSGVLGVDQPPFPGVGGGGLARHGHQ